MCLKISAFKFHTFSDFLDLHKNPAGTNEIQYKTTSKASNLSKPESVSSERGK